MSVPFRHFYYFGCLPWLWQIRRKQLSAKQQLDKWKASEALNQELVVEATAKLQRPKSVDPGTH